MRRKSRKNEKSEHNISMITLGGITLIIVIAFILSYVLYSSNISKQAKRTTNNTQKISTTADNNMLNMITNSENSQSVSTAIGKSVNEMENTIKNNENTTKMAINTSRAEEKNNETKTENKNTDTTTDTKNEEPTNQDPTLDPTFIKPVEGEKIKDYSKDNLIYSNTLAEWTTHLGIDYIAQKTDVVKASADGKIKSIKNDPRYGLTVVIEHSNGFESIYSSLLTAEFITVGETVEKGQTIATVGNTATFEIADETHIHFEIKKDGVNVDPNIYIK